MGLNSFPSLHLHPQRRGVLRAVGVVVPPEQHRINHSARACDSKTAIQAQTNLPIRNQSRPLDNMSLETLKKHELQQLMRDHGEDPPDRWTKVELRQRLVELEPELGVKGRSGDRDTELRGMIRHINQARSKKINLIQLCEAELQLVLSGNETVAQLERRAVEQAHRLSAVDGRDYVGFGKHAGLQYQDINRYHESYRTWVLQTDAESPGADYRLRRLARWLRENPIQPDNDGEISQVLKAKAKATPRRANGYQKKTMDLPMSVVEHPPPTSSSAAPSAGMEQMAQVITQLASAVQSLQHDLNDMKEERPRKKDTKVKEHTAPSTMTSDDYSRVGDL